METETTDSVFWKLREILLNSDSTLSNLSTTDNERNVSLEDGITRNKIEDDFIINESSLDQCIPLLRAAIEEDVLEKTVEELINSIDDNFESVESQILQDAEVNDDLSASIQRISSIRGLVEGSLKAQVQELEKELAASVNELLIKKQAFIKNKKTSTKIKETTILINKIVRILELTNKCQDLIKDGNFFKALQNLENLERIYLQDFKNYNFKFLKEINASIPILKTKIKDESISLIKQSFNSNLEKTLLNLGTTLYSFYNDTLLPDWTSQKKSMNLGNFKFNSAVEISLRDQKRLMSLDLNQFYKLDELYDSILIFQNLKELSYLCDEFTKEYDFRKSKLVYPLELKSSVSSAFSNNQKDITEIFGKDVDMSMIKNYMLRVLGFLVYDRHLQKSTDSMLSDSSDSATDDFWDNYIAKLSPYLEHYVTVLLKTEEELDEFKGFLGIFVAVLENWAFNIEAIYAIQVLVFKKFCALLRFNFEQEFRVLLNDDDFMPLTVNDKDLFNKILRVCWVKKNELRDSAIIEENGASPSIATLPFSPLYPMTCTLIKKTYSKITAFLDDFFQHDLNYLSKVVVQTIDIIFSKIINERIRAKLDTTSREEIAQILINLDYFVIAAKEFSLILTRENIVQSPDIEIRLKSQKLLSETRAFAESKLIELIDSKVSDLMEFVEFDWNNDILEEEPHIFIKDIAQFLEMMFTSTLVNLPDSVKSLLIFREFDVLTKKFLDMLLLETPEIISPQSVSNFELNMDFLESVIWKIFPNDLSSPDSQGLASPDLSQNSDNPRISNVIENNIRSLRSTFGDLRQHIEFLKAQNLEEYRDSSLRMRKYPRIKPEVAQMLYSKVHVRPQSAEMMEKSSISIDPNFGETSGSNGRIAKFFNRS
ncbi:LAMI_0D02058g1_1 [Lachancea mirantina]|uniref:Exocyst complex component SEC15 n=1 Tax=Lachancea mirantina TaxID=1230905 RepID=A0A1G4J9G7_9SACH|nr:LAMI_0D02058g1_1 [Lachancea mirantina]